MYVFDKTVIEPLWNLEEVKADLFVVLAKAPWEAQSVRIAALEGKIDGGSYNGDCCCIKGIIAKDLGISTSELNKFYGIPLKSISPMEAFLSKVEAGDTPETNSYARFIVECLDEFIAQEEAKQAENLGASVQAGLEEVLASMPTVKENIPELVQV